MNALLETTFYDLAGEVEFASLRWLRRRSHSVGVRMGIPQPRHWGDNQGLMITVVTGGGLGYGATCDLTPSGITQAFESARQWAQHTALKGVMDFSAVAWPVGDGEYDGPCEIAPDTDHAAGLVDMLMEVDRHLGGHEKIVEHSTRLALAQLETVYLTGGSRGRGRIVQRSHHIGPHMQTVANEGHDTQIRSFGGFAGMQGGLEVLDRYNLPALADELVAEAVDLLAAPECPEESMDLLLAPDQMVLQIHESIGHPLEMDRILGDERNYAGRSFVTPEMIGSYQYGSELLNVTFDPTVAGQLASSSHDDEGLPARREYLIRNGTLERAMGGVTSQTRSGLPGVANSRADDWNRPPIDRMGNLNVEPGNSSLDDMIASVERGVYMRTNRSWSIDDSRNKFQFGCQWGRLIEDGKLTTLVKNPNYRGISESFWRNLKAVGNADTNELMGVTNCGKGEPNQVIFVGHASPACLFSDVAVFGGAQ